MSTSEKTSSDNAGSPPTSAEEPAPKDVLDWDAALQQNGVGPEAVGRLADLFLQESKTQLAEVEKTMKAGDAPALRRAAHTLKGSAAVFAAQRTTEAAKRLEMIAADGDLSQAEAAYDDLVRELERLRPALSEHLENPPDERG